MLLNFRLLHIEMLQRCWFVCTLVISPSARLKLASTHEVACDMQAMNVEGLTRENVASHLQKFRLQLRRDKD